MQPFTLQDIHILVKMNDRDNFVEQRATNYGEWEMHLVDSPQSGKHLCTIQHGDAAMTARNYFHGIWGAQPMKEIHFLLDADSSDTSFPLSLSSYAG